jgi:predicted heme/steroid binding protein
VKRHAKASSAGSTDGTGSARGLFRRAFATRGIASGSKGSGAPTSRRLRATLAVLALAIAACALTAAPALAAPPTVTTPVVSDISYTSVQVEGKVTTDGSGLFGFTNYVFEYCASGLDCTENTNWIEGFSSSFKGAATNQSVEGPINGLKGGTKYFVRLSAYNAIFGTPEIATSPQPNPSFTTLTADPPSVEATDNASEVKYTEVKVTGKVNRPNKSDDLTCNFEYITDAAYATNPVGERFAGATPVPCEPSPVKAVGSSKVEAKLTGLKPATIYHLRLAVSNANAADAKEAPATFTTLTVDSPTIVTVDNASAVFSASASASGKVKRLANEDPAFDVSACRFEYVTAADFTATGFAGATAVPCDQGTPFTTPGGETNVTAALTGLSPATTYHLRLAAEDAASAAATKEAAATFTTAPKVAQPTVVATGEATNVSKRSAEATGKVERPAGADPALNVSCRFEYVTDQQFTEHGFENAGQAPCLGPNEVQSLTIAATAGQFRLTYGGQTTADLAFNATAGEVQGALRNMGVEVLVGGGPGNGAGSTPYRITFVGGLAEKDVDQIVATDGATPLAGAANVTTLTTGATAFESLNGPPANQAKDIRVELSGLEPDTTYHLRLAAENGGGTVIKDAPSTFTTVAIIHPSFKINTPEAGYTSAHVSGEVDPGNQGDVWILEYAIDPDSEGWPGNAQNGGQLVNAGPPEPVSQVFTGLKAGTTYKVRFNSFDYEEFLQRTSEPPYTEFTTKGTSTPPSASLGSVTGVTANGAHFSGTVDTHAPAEALDSEGKTAYKTDWHFECTPECPAQPGISGTLQAEEGSQPVSLDVIRLLPNVFYEVKLIVHNDALGTFESNVQTFQTPLVPADVKPSPGGSDGKGGYTLEGIVNSNNSKVSDCHFEYGTTATYPNTYQVPCLPSPSGPDEVQQVSIDATEGQFKLSFRGQSTTDLPYNATPAAVQSALRALPAVGPSGLSVGGSPGAYAVTFGGKLAGSNIEQLKAGDGTTPLGGGSGASVSTTTEGGKNSPVSVEARLEGLTVGATYHFRIFATNAAGTASSPDRTFVPTLAPPSPGCANEVLRKESDSLPLPECRAYELVTAGIEAEREGNSTNFYDFAPGGDTVAYKTGASNIANSGMGSVAGALGSNLYAARRTATGWETIPNLNGPPGTSPFSPPESIEYAAESGRTHYAADYLSSIWALHTKEDSGNLAYVRPYLRKPDGSFHRIGNLVPYGLSTADAFAGASTDLSHVVYNAYSGLTPDPHSGHVVEYVGTGNDEPSQVDLNNSGNQIGSCDGSYGGGGHQVYALANAVSADGSTIVFSVNGGCGGANPAANEVWARIDGTTSYDVSASQCTRAAADPGGACNAPADATFAAATPDGSRVFFTTAQQLVNGDTDQTNDLYACDLPAAPQAPAGKANPCAALTEVSGVATEARVESVLNTSEDGSTAYFFSPAVLAANKDAFGDPALPGDHNLYVWRQDATHSDGQTVFVGRTGAVQDAQSGSDGRYLVLSTSGSLVETDTDSALDVYRYDAVTGEMTRISTGISGAGGNAEGLDAAIPAIVHNQETSGFNLRPAVSAAGDRIVFTTKEGLSPLDGNGASDVYLWSSGHVYLISGGSVGAGGTHPAIDNSGRDIYFTSEDGDVYDARTGGGFPSPPGKCSGDESCQPPASGPPAFKAPGSAQQSAGNPAQPKGCPKGKVKKHGKCVKKAPKKHHPKSPHKRAGSNGGGGK